MFTKLIIPAAACATPGAAPFATSSKYLISFCAPICWRLPRLLYFLPRIMWKARVAAQC